ncbi:bifunctional MFS transporter/dTMP kinase [Goodfellowiella coeruleoviolacea]|uniref:bifunctional MFS transporter/dTMP kinase n=1 Tax=Goodfellowiella coeruleoviolacea TaxID=334858 RepID=UPI0020A5F406|nr:dTMP kinase [Goodfellowiella coeruleoviolacea]
MLSIRAFRRLWGVTYLCSMGDWLSMLALSGLVGKLTEGYQWQTFAFSGVVFTQLLPGVLFAPVGGVLADRFDRRKVMVTADLLRCALLLSIALVGSVQWLFAANFLVGCCAMLWIPAKESGVPNLLRRSDQVETANQLGLVMTYGISVVSGAGLYSLVSSIPGALNLKGAEFSIAIIAVMITGLLYLASAILVATRIPELSGRPAVSRQRRAKEPAERGGFARMFREGLRFAGSTPLTRGLVIGMAGAFAAGGAVVGAARPYAFSLLGGDTAFSMLFVAVFVGLAVGMATAPRLARRLTHSRLFGTAIVAAGLALVVVALAPHLWVALVAVALVGASAGVAFLTGLTIIGSQVEDAIRGRIVAVQQSLMKIVLAAATALAPTLITLVQVRTITVFGHQMIIDGSRPVLLGAGVLAAVVGVVAYRQMDDRRTEPILSDLLAAIRGRPRPSNGLLIAIEGATPADTNAQANRLAAALRAEDRPVLLAHDPELNDIQLNSVLATVPLISPRSHALVAAAVRADMVEQRIRPALDAGTLVVMERYLDTPTAHFSAQGSLDQAELEGLADWATGRLRPDITVLLDRAAPDPVTGPAGLDGVRYHWQVQRLLSEMAAADPERYVVVDAEGTDEEVAARVWAALTPILTQRRPRRPQPTPPPTPPLQSPPPDEAGPVLADTVLTDTARTDTALAGTGPGEPAEPSAGAAGSSGTAGPTGSSGTARVEGV